MKKQIFPQLILLVLTTIIVSTIVYYGFASSYSSKVFSKKTCTEKYSQGVYKYRIFSTELLYLVNDWVESNVEDSKLLDNGNSNYGMDNEFSDNFYFSYFILNTFFFVLTTIVFVYIFNNSLINLSQSEKLLPQVFIIFIIAITQYTVVPYDNLSYFFTAGFILALMHYYKSESLFRLTIAGLILLVATLNRETTALFISAFATIQILKYGVVKKTILNFAYLLLFFIIPYLVLRFVIIPYDGTATFFLNVYENFTELSNIIGILFWIVFGTIIYQLSKNEINRKAFLLFIVVSFPYILFSFMIGVMFETRLFVPISLIAIVISQLDFEKLGLLNDKFVSTNSIK